jgi:hypothetical protein
MKRVLVLALVLGSYLVSAPYAQARRKTCFHQETIDDLILPPEHKPITIFIHGGARPLSSLLCFPGFYNECPTGLLPARLVGGGCALGKKVASVLSKADPQEYPFSAFYVFGWSGLLSAGSRRKAGRQLYKTICYLKEDPRYASAPITIITHSHGGNVALEAAVAAWEKGDTRTLVNKLIITACPVHESTACFVCAPLFTKVIALYSKSDPFQVLDPQGLYTTACAGKCPPFLSKRRFEPCSRLVQAEVKFNHRSSTGHLGFITRKFLRNLPRILAILESPTTRTALPRYKGGYCVSINNKGEPVTACRMRKSCFS